MATNQQARTDSPDSPTEPPARRRTRSDSGTQVPPAELLELLGDGYTQRILSALGDGPRTGSELLDALDISKPTVYRRLGRLEEAGLVETTRRIDPDGHHCKEYHAVVETIDVEFGSDGIGIAIETASASSSRGQASPMVADD
jgi:DNA-binding HxlR family transcriptional regulator